MCVIVFLWLACVFVCLCVHINVCVSLLELKHAPCLCVRVPRLYHTPQAYVDRGGDITTPEMVVEALLSNPLRNTMVALVDFDTARLAVLAKVMAGASVTGSAAIRHAVYGPEGIRVGRHCSVAPTALIPQAYIDRVLAEALEGVDDLPTITGVTFEGQAKPSVLSLSRVWKPKRGDGVGIAAPAAADDTLPCRDVHSAACGGLEFLQCTVCDRLFTSVLRYSGHACREAVATTVVARGSALAVERAPYSAPLPVVALPAAANAATVTALPRGWARPVARDKEFLDETAVRLITQWFEEGAAGGGKTKCSAATALQRLRVLRTPAGALVYEDEDALPSEARIKRFFGSLSQKRRAAVHAGV